MLSITPSKNFCSIKSMGSIISIECISLNIQIMKFEFLKIAKLLKVNLTITLFYMQTNVPKQYYTFLFPSETSILVVQSHLFLKLT